MGSHVHFANKRRNSPKFGPLLYRDFADDEDDEEEDGDDEDEQDRDSLDEPNQLAQQFVAPPNWFGGAESPSQTGNSPTGGFYVAATRASGGEHQPGALSWLGAAGTQSSVCSGKCHAQPSATSPRPLGASGAAAAAASESRPTLWRHWRCNQVTRSEGARQSMR